jgi:CAAX prenyl protease-like protein
MIRSAEKAAVPESRAKWHPAAPYVLPFVVFMALLVAARHLSFLGPAEYLVRVAILAVVLWVFSRHVIDLRVRHWPGTIAVGVVVFAIWVAPDVLFPGYRSHWLFQNAITGQLGSSIDAGLRTDWFVLLFRTLRAVVLVAIIEELFWRGWLMRWLISADFEKVPLGAYSLWSMAISALLFASEHGPYWDVGFAAGLLYNWWMIRTKSLGDCIAAHGLTNACLSAYVIATGEWEYWF